MTGSPALCIDQLLKNLRSCSSEELESEQIEFKGYRDTKSFWNNISEIAKELTAFANKRGGCLIVGVKDSSDIENQDWPSQLVGIEKIDELEIKKRLRDKLRPHVELNIMNHEYEGKNYIIIKISDQVDTLVGTSGAKYYIRDGRESRPMEPLEIQNTVKSLRKYDWSQDIIEVSDVDGCLDSDVIDSAIEEFGNLREYGSNPPVKIFLESIGATINGKLTKGGLLFLGTQESIEKYIGRIEYRVSKKERGGCLPINEVWIGSLWGAIEKTLSIFDEIIKYTEFTYDGKKFAFPTMDKIAFNEAFINALVHRDYTSDGMVNVDFTENRVTISNPGSFYGGVSTDNIFLHQPRHRNKALSSIFMNFKLMDRAGQGTKRMTVNSLKYGRKKPVFLNKNNSVEVIFESNSINKDLFVKTAEFNNYDVAEFTIINNLLKISKVDLKTIYDELKSISNTPWLEIKDAIDRIDYIDIEGDNNGAYLKVKDKPGLLKRIFRPKKKRTEHFR